jgi:hypothetical protein
MLGLVRKSRAVIQTHLLVVHVERHGIVVNFRVHTILKLNFSIVDQVNGHLEYGNLIVISLLARSSIRAVNKLPAGKMENG